MAIFSFQMNKNMTSGEGGCVVTNDARLYNRAVACHDTGTLAAPMDELFDDLELCLWGRGYRLDEMRASILRVQLRKLPTVIAHMNRSKYRIRQALAGYPGIDLRKIVDPLGDTGCFLLTTYPGSPETAKTNQPGAASRRNCDLPQGVNNIVMTEWGLHIYYNIPSLVRKTGVDKRNSPWSLAENSESQHGIWQRHVPRCR